jgi:hypothetical protein
MVGKSAVLAATHGHRGIPQGGENPLLSKGSRGAPGRIRTCDARFRKPTLYPLSYGGGAGRLRGAKPTRSSILGGPFRSNRFDRGGGAAALATQRPES